MTRPRVVLDTNCLVSALIFSRGCFAWLREAWQGGRCVPLASRDTVGELLRVLNYPKFKLSRDEQEALLAEFCPMSRPSASRRRLRGFRIFGTPTMWSFWHWRLLPRPMRLSAGTATFMRSRRTSRFRS